MLLPSPRLSFSPLFLILSIVFHLAHSLPISYLSISVRLQWPYHLKRTLKRDGRDKERERDGGERRRRRKGRLRCEARSRGSLSVADKDTFAPELWNCVVWNWNGGTSGAVICNTLQLLQHFEGDPNHWLPPPKPSLSYFQFPLAIFSLSLCFYFRLNSSRSFLLTFCSPSISFLL